MRAAARDGNLLSYANNLARSMAGSRVVDETRREPVVRQRQPLFQEDAVETRYNPNTVRPPTPQPSSTRQPEEQIRREDGVRVSRL